MCMPNEKCSADIMATHEDLLPHEVAVLISHAGKKPLDLRFRDLACAHIERIMMSTFNVAKFAGAVTTFYKFYGNTALLGILYENVLSRSGRQLSPSFLRQYLVALAYHNIHSAVRFVHIAMDNTLVALAFEDAPPRGTESQIPGWFDLPGKKRAAIVLAGILIGRCHVLSAWAQREHDEPNSLADEQKEKFKGAFAASLEVLKFVSANQLPLSGETIGRCIMLLSVPIRSPYYPDKLCPREAASILNCLTQHHIIISPAVGNWIGNAWIRVVGRIGNGVDQVWNIVNTMAQMGFIHEMEDSKQKKALSGRPATSKVAKIAVRHIVNRAYAQERRDTRSRYCTACNGALSSLLDRAPIDHRFKPCRAQDFIAEVNQQSFLLSTALGSFR